MHHYAYRTLQVHTHWWVVRVQIQKHATSKCMGNSDGSTLHVAHNAIEMLSISGNFVGLSYPYI